MAQLAILRDQDHGPDQPLLAQGLVNDVSDAGGQAARQGNRRREHGETSAMSGMPMMKAARLKKK